MKQHIACCPFLMAGACLLSVVQSVHAQTANDILNKATAVYANAKTYQASFDKEEDDLHEDKTTDSHETETVHVKAIGTTKFTLDNLKSHRFDDSSVDDWHISIMAKITTFTCHIGEQLFKVHARQLDVNRSDQWNVGHDNAPVETETRLYLHFACVGCR